MKNYIGTVLLNDSEEIYLIKEDDVNDIGQNRWNLPGGSSEDGESLIESVKRETLEETGYTVEVKSLLGCYKCFKKDISWLYIVFETKILGDQSATIDPNVKEGKWFSKIEFLKLSKEEIVHPDMQLVYEIATTHKSLSLDSVKFINYG